MPTEITFGLIDVTAKKDSAPVTNGQKPFSALADLRRNDGAAPHVATGEDWQWLLDGSYEPFPDAPERSGGWGWFSSAQSDGTGRFVEPPEMTIAFTKPHSSAGVTLHMGDPCPHRVRVRWHSLTGTLLDDKTFTLDGLTADPFMENAVYGYGKLTLTFLESGLPHRYVRVHGIDFGMLHTFAGTELTEVTILEEVDPTLSTLPDNTLEVSAYSGDVDFSILEPKGVYTMLSENQPLRVTHNGVSFGTFYLSEWEVGDMWMEDGENGPENWTAATLRCVSAIGVLDQVKVLGGIYSDAKMENVVAEIMADTAVDYVLDEALRNVAVNGWLPICTARQALQQVAFAANARVDASRKDFLSIAPADVSRSCRWIGKERKLTGGVIRLAPFVSGVEVVGHSYTLVAADAAVALFTGKLGEGEHQVEFGAPAHTFTATNGTLLKTGPNYALIKVTAAQAALEQKITGKPYQEGTNTARVGDLLTKVDNVISVTDATLVSQTAALGIARRLYDASQRRHISESGLLMGSEQCGDLAEIFALEKRTADGVQTRTVWGDVVRMEINLAEEMVEKAVIRGVAR